jgi:hypothetical protein
MDFISYGKKLQKEVGEKCIAVQLERNKSSVFSITRLIVGFYGVYHIKRKN